VARLPQITQAARRCRLRLAATGQQALTSVNAQVERNRVTGVGKLRQGLHGPCTDLSLRTYLTIVMQGVVRPHSVAGSPSIRSSRRSTPLRLSAYQQNNSATLERTAYKGDPSKALEVDPESIKKDIRLKAEVTVGAPDSTSLTPEEAYRAAAWSVREKLFDAFFATQKYWECAASLHACPGLSYPDPSMCDSS